MARRIARHGRIKLGCVARFSPVHRLEAARVNIGASASAVAPKARAIRARSVIPAIRATAMGTSLGATMGATMSATLGEIRRRLVIIARGHAAVMVCMLQQTVHQHPIATTLSITRQLKVALGDLRGRAFYAQIARAVRIAILLARRRTAARRGDYFA